METGINDAHARCADGRAKGPLGLGPALLGLALLLAGLLPAGHAAAETSLDQGGLFDELRRYTQGGSSPHRGGVYDHSAWTAMAVCEWFGEKDNLWTQGLDRDKDFKVAVIAAFMHDIGKAGDRKYALGDGEGFKPEHPKTGYEYLTGTQRFLMTDDTALDFKAWQRKVDLSDSDYKIVAVTTRIHYDFGEQVMQKWSARPEENAARVQNFLSKLRHYAILEDYPVDERLLRVVLLVSAADVRGQREVAHGCPGFAAFDKIGKPRDGGADNFANWGFNGDKGKAARALALSEFRKGTDLVFYHGTKLEYAMDIVANGIKLLKPVNGSELGLGFYVSRDAFVVTNYGDTYLEVTSALKDQDLRQCARLEDLLANENFNKAYVANTGRNGFDGWWKNPELIPIVFDAPYNPPATWLKNDVAASPVCVTRRSFGDQLKFNFSMRLADGKDPPFDAVLPLKGMPAIRSVCHKETGSREFDCQPVENFKRKHARQWAARKMQIAQRNIETNKVGLGKLSRCIEETVRQSMQSQADVSAIVAELVSTDADCKALSKGIVENMAEVTALTKQLENPVFKNEQ